MSRKHVTDEMVCQAYADYQQSLASERASIPPGYIFGVGEPLPHVPWPYELLAKRTGEHWKVCYSAMVRACDRGLIEYGTSLRSGWLTEKGKELLKP